MSLQYIAIIVSGDILPKLLYSMIQYDAMETLNSRTPTPWD